MPLPDLTQSLVAAYRRLGASGSRVLLAVSGGADSMALLHGTARGAPGIPVRSLAVASLDHGLRSEGASEVALVRSQCEALGVPFFTETLTLAPGSALEARAREARYEALERLRQRAEADVIATAHTETDQAETVLMRLSRGASLRGLASIRERRGTVIRPMLGLSRAEVLAFLEAHGIPFVTDPMNADPRFLRSRVRSDAMPVLRRVVGPGVDRALARFAEQAGEDEAWLELEARRALGRITFADRSLDRPSLLALPRPIGRRALRAYLEEEGLAVDAEVISGALEAAEAGHRLGLPGRAVLATAGGRVRLERARPALPLPELEQSASAPGDTVLHIPLPDDVEGPFEARRPRPGDRVRLAGGRVRKLQDLLVDLRVPREERAGLCVVVERHGRVIWLPGIWSTPAERGASTKWLIARVP